MCVFFPDMSNLTKRKVNGAAVRAFRQTVGIKQTDLALRANVTSGTLSRIESGARQPSPPVARKLADGLGVSLEAITYPVTVIVKVV